MVLCYAFYIIFILLGILIIITLNCIFDKLLTSTSFSSSGEFFYFFNWGLLLCLPILTAFFVLFSIYYVDLQRLQCRLMPDLTYCLILVLRNLFGAFNDLQPVAPSAGSVWMRNRPSCVPWLAFTSARSRRVSVKVSEQPKICLWLKAAC